MNRVLDILLAIAAAPVRWVAARRRESEQSAPLDNMRIDHGWRSPPHGFWKSSLATLRRATTGAEKHEAVGRNLADELRGYLEDVAIRYGATDAMLWMRVSESAAFRPVAWNRPGAPPFVPWGTEQQRALVSWAVGEAVVCFDGTLEKSFLAACQVRLDDAVALGAAARSGGALVLYSPEGISSSRADLKFWLPRHAKRAAQFVDLDLTRNEVARQNYRLRALIRDAHRLQAAGDPETLEREITDSALDVSGAEFGALVRWDYELEQGTICWVTPGYPAPVPEIGQVVGGDSLIADVCRNGEPALWEDARALAGKAPLFSSTLPAPYSGSLAILAVRRGPPTIGAVVMGTLEPGGIRPNDLRTTKLLMHLAASALEAAWKIELVSRRSVTDVLTGLWNRRHFDDQLQRVLVETDRYGKESALVILDIDHFKKVNDSYGHPAGDAVLRMVAGAMKELVRTTDVCARIGGEELCVILPQTDAVGALELAERLREKIESTAVPWRAGTIHVTASFGVATYGAGGGPAEKASLFQEADRALYKAKADGRNCVRTQGPTLVTG
jgi:diguanylate cyclase (GGDEF)-like protein